MTCDVAGKKLLIECKRPMTEAGARSRIRQAMKTIDREAKLEKPGTRGVLAMSITKLINPGDAIFSGTNEADARVGLNDLVRRKATELSGVWSRSGTKVVGIMFYVITPAFLEDRKILALQQRTNGYGLAPEGSADLQAFKGLMSSLEKVWY